MMTTEEMKKKIQELPGPVREFFLGYPFAERNADIFDRHGITERADKGKLLDVEREIFVRAIPLTSLADELRIRLKLPPDRAKVLALQIASEQMLPVADYLGDVPGLIQILGGDISITKTDRVALAFLTVDEAVEKVLTLVRPGTTDEVALRRIREALTSLLRDARTASQTKDALTRGAKIGGAGMEAEIAERLIGEAGTIKKSVKVVSTTPAARLPGGQEVGGYQPKDHKAGRRGLEPAKPLTPKDATTKDETEITREITHIKKSVLPERAAGTGAQVPLMITDATDRLVAELKGTVPQELLARFKTAVSARLRDVRDEAETRELLARAVQAGGLGLAGELLAHVMERLEATDRDMHAKLGAAQTQSKGEWVRSSRQAVVAREEARATGEQAERDAVYAKVAGGKARSSTPPILPPALPAGRSGRGGIEQQSMSPPLRGGDRGGVAGGIPSARPQLHDVKPATKLVGPVEEIALMTPDQFRRLGATPADATARLLDKIEVLRSESFSLRNDAIKAWQKSPMVSLYREITAESLKQGKPVATILLERSKSGQPSFSQAEFNAIMELSRKLRF